MKKSRLHRQIWLGFTAVALLVACLTVGVGKVLGGFGPDDVPPALIAVAELIAEDLPAEPDQADIDALSARLGTSITLHGAQTLSAGTPIPPPRTAGAHYTWRSGPGCCVPVRQGMLCAAMRPHGIWPGLRAVGSLLAVVGVIGLASYPIARRLTRRLQRLETAVTRLGEGDLKARVEVHGRDEVAQLAQAFNDAAERIEGLVTAQRRTLANASHELRSPLARLQLALELGDHDEARANIRELDGLVGELLLQSRMEARALRLEDIDLRRLADDEVGRAGGTVEGEGRMMGDSAGLRSLLRNLLENARKYGRDPIVVRVWPGGFEVCDGGEGVPEAERARIFEPFYRRAGHSEAQGGVGLGLALARQIADAHGVKLEYVHPATFRCG